jgi:hypothetical protein
MGRWITDIWRFVVTVMVIVIVCAERQASADESQPGVIQIARWDVLLTEGGMDPFDQLDRKSVETTSKVYQAAMYDAAALRGAVNAAKSLGGLEGANQNMATSYSNDPSHIYMNQSLYFGYYNNQDQKAGINGSANGRESLDIVDGGAAVHLSMDLQNIRLQIHDAGQSWSQLQETPAIVYDGKIAPGQALAFRGALKSPQGQTYYHLIVWDVVRTEPRYQQNMQNVQSPEWWCQLGPDGIRAATDVSLVWATKAKHEPSQVSPKWERKLDDGKTLKLTGITRTDKWLYCWWDADGQPIAPTTSVGLSSYAQRQPPAWFTVELRGGADEWAKATPTNHPGDEQRQVNTGEYNSSATFTTNEKGEAVVGVPVGDWQQLGEIKKGGSIKIDNVNYRIRQTNANGDQGFYVYLQRDRGADNGDLIALSAVSVDDKELDSSYLPQLVGENYGMSMPQFNGMPLAKLKVFHVWKRKRQWVRFTDFAKEPAESPPAQVSAADLTAAASAREQQQQHEQEQAAEKQLAATKQKRDEWLAIPATATTPKGALRLMMQSAAAGDREAVRKRLIAKNPDDGPMLDLMAQFLTAGQSVWTRAAGRFGEPAIAAMRVIDNQPTGLMDMEAELFSTPWQPRDDGGLQGHEMNVIKGDGGEYYLDVSSALGQPNSRQELIQQIKPMTERMEKLNQMLIDQPQMTVQQFREALTNQAAAKKPG